MADWKKGIAISSSPLRKVVRRSSHISNGWHRTGKNPNGFIGGESRGELLFLMFAEMDPNVTAIAPQPCDVPFSHEGRLKRHIPDFAVMERGESHIFEVKSRQQYERHDIQSRLRSAGRTIESLGWPYHVALKDEMLADPRHDAVADLWSYFRPTFDDLQRMAVEQAVASGERIVADVVAELASSMGDRAPSLERVLSMAANGFVYIVFDAPIGEASVIRAADPSALPEPLIPRRRPADDLPWNVAA